MDGDIAEAGGDNTCAFCALPANRVLFATGTALAFRDLHPVSPGHTLVIPRRHVADWWELTREERAEIGELVDRVKDALDDERAPDGYNVGFNAGAAAGQTVFHAHVHVIPRYDGDVPDPRGGVRHVIPHMGNYLDERVVRSPRVDAPPVGQEEPQPQREAPPTGEEAGPSGGWPANRLRPDQSGLGAGWEGTSSSSPGPTGTESRQQTPAPPPGGAGPPRQELPGQDHGHGGASAVESALHESPLGRAGDRPDSAALTQQVLGVLDEGHRSATYKPALLLALVELATERVAGPEELTLPLADVAERIMELYWPQTRHHPEAAGGTLRQTTTARSRVVGALLDLRREARAVGSEPIGRVRLTAPDAHARALARVIRALAKQPVPRLQRPGKGSGASFYPRFLFDDSDYVAEAGWRGEGEPAITLKPGVAEALARAAPLMRIAAQDVWTREVGALNRLHLQDQELRAFLFGSQRTHLASVAESLRDAGEHRCFWCRQPLRRASGVEVDHVIPWSHYPNDDLFNLVLTDRGCNNDKRDRLVTDALVDRWTQRDRDALRSLAEELQWPMQPLRSGLVARSAYRYLPDGVPVWEGRHHLRPFDGPQRARIEKALALILT